MLRARRSPDDIQNNVWLLTDEPEIETKGGLTKKVFDPVTLPWTVETEEQAIAAVLEVKAYFEAEAAKEEKPEPKGKDAKKTPIDIAAQAKLDAAITEGANALRDQLGDKADEIVAHEPQDETLLRVLADVLTNAGSAIRQHGLNRAELVAKLQESLPPKSAIIRV